RDQLLRAFERMLAFYGFARTIRNGRVRIEPSDNWPVRARVWLRPHDHNHLRMTRILKSLMLLHLPDEARAFFRALREVYESEGSGRISDRTMQFWTSAVQEKGPARP